MLILTYVLRNIEVCKLKKVYPLEVGLLIKQTIANNKDLG